MIWWLVKLCLKVVLLPVYVVTAALNLFLNLALRFGSVVVGLMALLMLHGIAVQLAQRHWDQAALAFGISAAGIAVFICAGLLVGAVESAKGHIAGFIFG